MNLTWGARVQTSMLQSYPKPVGSELIVLSSRIIRKGEHRLIKEKERTLLRVGGDPREENPASLGVPCPVDLIPGSFFF